jgi:hypothetical protein
VAVVRAQVHVAEQDGIGHEDGELAWLGDWGERSVGLALFKDA